MISYEYSTKVLDIWHSSDKVGTSVLQSFPTKRFNQRWNLINSSHGQVFIENLKSKLVLEIKGSHCKEGSFVTQGKKQENNKNQLWILEEQGKRLYLIRSVADK